MPDSRKTTELLSRLGLSKNEIKCFLASLSLGPASMGELARRAGVNRVNAYTTVKLLIERGLLLQELQGNGVRKIHPAPLTHLQELALEQQKRATKLRWKIEDLIPALVAASSGAQKSSVADVGEVLFFRGEDTYYQIADRTLSAPPGSTICLLESFDFFYSLPDNPNYDDEIYRPTRIARKIYARILHHPDERSKKLQKLDAKQLREIRFLPPEMSFSCSIYLYGKEVVFLWTQEEGNRDTTRAVVVIGGPLVALMQQMFEMVWEQCKQRK